MVGDEGALLFNESLIYYIPNTREVKLEKICSDNNRGEELRAFFGL
jgi:hypothetical protein